MLTDNQCRYFNGFTHFLTKEFDEVFDLAWKGKGILLQIPNDVIPTVTLLESTQVMQGISLSGLVLPVRIFHRDDYASSKEETMYYLVSTFHDLLKQTF